jgi:hypothetical protein
LPIAGTGKIGKHKDSFHEDGMKKEQTAQSNKKLVPRADADGMAPHRRFAAQSPLVPRARARNKRKPTKTSENIRIAALVPLSEAYPDINRVSKNGSISVRRSARLGVGKRRIWTNWTPKKKGRGCTLCTPKKNGVGTFACS